MDPKATLLSARELLMNSIRDDDDHYANAASHLMDYVDWRFKGGFNPDIPELNTTGDELLSTLMSHLGDCADVMGSQLI